jgi:hypothetical protein
MAMRGHLGAMLTVGVLTAWMVIACPAQSKPASAPPPTSAGPAPCSVAPEPEPCGTTPAPSGKPNTAEKFPFPGEAQGSSTPSLGGVPDAPDTPSSPEPATKNFPFPGDAGSSATPSPSSSSSSSNSGDDAIPADSDAAPGSTPELKDKGTEGTPPAPGRHILHRVNPVGTKLQSNDEREQEDLDVAHFYVQSGDLQGAYKRSQDAVKIAPDDPDAHFALAEIALKLNKRDEAIAEYNACVKLDPTEKELKESRKALARLKP